MNNLSMIACISSDYGLGHENDLLWRIPADQRFFRETTLGSIVVMGAHTFASIGRPLPKRKNYIVTRHPERFSGTPNSDLQFFSTLDALEVALADLEDEVFILCGSSLYRHFLPLAKRILLTEVQAVQPADTYFPGFDHDLYNRSVLQTGNYDDVNYEIVEYKRR